MALEVGKIVLGAAATYVAAKAAVDIGVGIGNAIADSVNSAQSAQSIMPSREATRDWAKAQAKARSYNDNDLRDYSVYVMENRHTFEIDYVGMTKNYGRRKYVHQNSPFARYDPDSYNMIVVATGLTRREARALEQILISAFGLDSLNNMINSIAERRWGEFQKEFERFTKLINGCSNG